MFEEIVNSDGDESNYEGLNNSQYNYSFHFRTQLNEMSSENYDENYEQNIVLFEDNKDLHENKNFQYFHPLNFPNEKTTNYQTNKNEIDSGKNNIIINSQKKEATVDDDNYETIENFYSFEKIKNFLEKNVKSKTVLQKFQKNENIREAEEKLCKKKRKREENIRKPTEEIKEENKTKRGRKKSQKNDNNREEHNKMSSDNIIKNIKSKLFPLLIESINNIIKKSAEDKPKLYKLNYKYVNQLNKEIDLKYLNMTLKELVSKEISSKYKIIPSDANKTFIESLINKTNETKEEFSEDYDTILFVLNMTFREWLDLFTYKKNINDLKAQHEQLKYINYEKIENNISGLNNLLEELMDNHDEKYFSFFIFYLYNYERWFSIKSGRNRKNKNNIIIIDDDDI